MSIIHAIVFAGAYLLGAVPFGYIIYRLRSGRDIRAEGSGNIGATNVTRRAGLAAGIATLVLDFAKGYAAVLVATAVTHDPLALAIAAFSAVLGHVFPVYLGFRGGKGVATAAGVFSALAPASVLLALVVFAALFAVFRYVSLGSIFAVGSVPLFMMLLGVPSRQVLFSAFATALLIIARHQSNIRRLLAGNEHRLDFKRPAGG